MKKYIKSPAAKRIPRQRERSGGVERLCGGKIADMRASARIGTSVQRQRGRMCAVVNSVDDHFVIAVGGRCIERVHVLEFGLEIQGVGSCGEWIDQAARQRLHGGAGD